MVIDVQKTILFTGAGFTHNFGGFLAKDMWARIFNHPKIQANERLRSLLLETDDYEWVYTKVMEVASYTEQDKQLLQEVVEGAYKKLDDSIRGLDSNNSINYHSFGGPFLQLFFGRNGKQGLFFSLNQDLFMERKNNFHSAGAPKFPHEFTSLSGREFENKYFVTLPSQDAKLQFEKGLKEHQGLHYIKLHGSYGWRSSNGTNQMVIGNNKQDNISKEPLLKIYSDFFKETIALGGIKLVVIGYGFRDMYINKILLDSVKQHNLQLYVITPKSMQEFTYAIENGHYYARGIIEGIRGYFPSTLKDIFPKSISQSVLFGEIKSALM